jgi:hypothetical protein
MLVLLRLFCRKPYIGQPFEGGGLVIAHTARENIL